MGMGYIAAFDIVVEKKELEKLNMKTLQSLFNTLKKYAVSLEDLARALYYNDALGLENEEEEKEIFNALYAFQEEFKALTNMNIYLNYHNSSDDGDRYDQVDGAYFALDFVEVYELTSNAKRLKQIQDVDFDIKSFVVFG